MAHIIDLPKTSTFTKYIKPDKRVPTIESALENKDNITNTPRNLVAGGFTWVLPTPRQEYDFLIANPKAIEDFGLTQDEINDPVFKKIVSGEFYEDQKQFQKHGFPMPYAQAYAGWQFGQFAGQLGDGRVVNLFEVPKPKPDGENRDVYELQLKGAGKTPFSRFADGKAVLRSSIREYIISEHLNAIGIPSTRALALTYLPSTLAQRHGAERCAIVARFSESWVRLGSFDLYRWRGDREGVRDLSDYVINELFTINGVKFQNFERIIGIKKHFFTKSSISIDDLTDYDKMYFETIIRNAETTAMCQAYGFLNGVLNTDNTSILGLTIDFGPFSIMDKYDPNYTPNSEDHTARYGYRNVPTAIWWNLTRLGEDLAELIGAGNELLGNPDFKAEVKEEWEDSIIKRATKIIEIGGEIYQYAYTKKYVETLFNRLGLSHDLIDPQNPDLQVDTVISPMLDILYKIQTDFNLFFVQLQDIDLTSGEYAAIAEKEFLKNYEFSTFRHHKDDLIKDIAAWLIDYQELREKSKTLSSRPDPSKFNPKFLPRNWILDQVIDQTTESRGDETSYLEKLQKMSSNPFDETKWGDEEKELEKSWLQQGNKGDEFAMLQCGCSS
ncbi:FMP40 Protein adenylyltransferase SelO [Candida maltosa Xu316]|uniref:Selenoprotein O n=1 Tax=Candida maltosa (strain Xu316) TaxID=1245528 RepID=M3K342_CANMX|nr:putative mitochondrial protein Fmp40 [Candida maltosa Xu316]